MFWPLPVPSQNTYWSPFAASATLGGDPSGPIRVPADVSTAEDPLQSPADAV